MHLIIKHDSPTNTIISNTTGQVLYRSETPTKWTKLIGNSRKTRIYKIVPNEYEDDMRDRFAEVAQIEWRGPKTTVFRYRGKESLTKDYFRHMGRSGRWV